MILLLMYWNGGNLAIDDKLVMLLIYNYLIHCFSDVLKFHYHKCN
jgi:hypothetical protein